MHFLLRFIVFNSDDHFWRNWSHIRCLYSCSLTLKYLWNECLVPLDMQWCIPANTKHLYNICTTLSQRLWRWSNIVQMLYKCFVFAVYVPLYKLADAPFHIQMDGLFIRPAILFITPCCWFICPAFGQKAGHWIAVYILNSIKGDLSPLI